MKREHKEHLIAAELRSAGGSPELLVRKVRAVDLPFARKRCAPVPTSSTVTNEKTGGGRQQDGARRHDICPGLAQYQVWRPKLERGVGHGSNEVRRKHE